MEDIWSNFIIKTNQTVSIPYNLNARSAARMALSVHL